MLLEVSQGGEKLKLKTGNDYEIGQVTWTISLLEVIQESVCLTFTPKIGNFWPFALLNPLAKFPKMALFCHF